MPEPRTVALVTLGCARNEVDSEELAGRLAADGWRLVEDASDADVAVVNTCGFVDAAKKDSVDALLEANDLKGQARTQAVVAVGCMAERYGKELAEALPEADAVLGFDDYADISDRLRTILSGGVHAPHTPRDRRQLLPISPAERQNATVALPGHAQPAPQNVPADLPEGIAPASGPRTPLRRRLDGGPVASVKLASGCDRRCAFCAIPSFRGSFVSRRPSDVLGETRWLAEQGVKEVMLVSENNTSYGKDLGDIRLLETLLPELAAVDGIERIRVSYLQPAEMRPGLIDVLTGTPKVAPYFDLSFQHSAPGVLRAMRRFGDTDRFLELLETIRGKAPQAGVRSNFIVGFPGETEADLAELERFLNGARLDAVGVFGYSDEEGTEAAGYDGKLPQDVVSDRLAHISRLAEELTAQRAEDRLGETVEVLVESVSAGFADGSADGSAIDGAGSGVGGSGGHGDGDGEEYAAVGRAAHQAPETDGQILLTERHGLAPGSMVTAKVVDTDGVDLVAEPLAGGTRGVCG
ncbi:30S ribosomal protein S12 methylthiotransferase RimO [Streptantibioticus silvisoli]|uniref:Ribosomal protein uS12 methylthiotransferase RimO n=1 Tax=Streptantibioticus silvisoli TaxID=2705255 RepID=A0ABT6WAF9_9ACTN|nr:30S ribosomal protein S12 methylthiotransferase RimO [Streptantibioticus silvisoli]MDI5967011.1 30S ribosomal protein S12 methylthiotransferase RimO [Streptantibioticus silvisoli]